MGSLHPARHLRKQRLPLPPAAYNKESSGRTCSAIDGNCVGSDVKAGQSWFCLRRPQGLCRVRHYICSNYLEALPVWAWRCRSRKSVPHRPHGVCDGAAGMHMCQGSPLLALSASASGRYAGCRTAWQASPTLRCPPQACQCCRSANSGPAQSVCACPPAVLVSSVGACRSKTLLIVVCYSRLLSFPPQPSPAPLSPSTMAAWIRNRLTGVPA